QHAGARSFVSPRRTLFCNLADPFESGWQIPESEDHAELTTSLESSRPARLSSCPEPDSRRSRGTLSRKPPQHFADRNIRRRVRLARSAPRGWPQRIVTCLLPPEKRKIRLGGG